ncbi:MAG: ABC transporter permease, partial [Gammaproteobacteria bacterium]|nr:ABC transporter permease [Gammaproteobacteria bacterium]
MLSSFRQSFLLKPLLTVIVLALAYFVLPHFFSTKPVYLWTDRLIFILLVAIIFLVAYIRHKPHLLNPWKQVFQSRRALVSAVVLSVYVVVGLLDSIHFQKPLTENEGEQHYSVEVFTVLDTLLSHLHTQVEKTYSAPFATHLFAKETMTAEDGKQYRAYPRLQYGGQHLENPEQQKTQDIIFNSLKGMLTGVVIWSVIALSLLFYLKQKHSLSFAEVSKQYLKENRFLPFRVVLVTSGILLIVASAIWQLSTLYHVFGTDKVGQDVLYLSLKSIRTGLVIGTLTTLVMLPFAVLLGIMAGYFRGWIDDVIQYIYTTLSSVPGVLLIAAAILSIQVYMTNHPEFFESARDQADLRLLALCVVLGITGWTGLCRLLRGEVLKLREMDYIQAATAFGVGHFTIIGRHLLPNVLHIVLIMVVLDFSGLVLAEAVLSYVQVGVDPSTIS